MDSESGASLGLFHAPLNTLLNRVVRISYKTDLPFLDHTCPFYMTFTLTQL